MIITGYEKVVTETNNSLGNVYCVDKSAEKRGFPTQASMTSDQNPLMAVRIEIDSA